MSLAIDHGSGLVQVASTVTFLKLGAVSTILVQDEPVRGLQLAFSYGFEEGQPPYQIRSSLNVEGPPKWIFHFLNPIGSSNGSLQPLAIEGELGRVEVMFHLDLLRNREFARLSLEIRYLKKVGGAA